MEDSARFEAFLLDLLQRCSGAPGPALDETIVRALKQAVEAAVTDLAAIVEFEPVGSHVRIAHLWARPGIDRTAAGAAAEFSISQHVSQLARGETVAIEHAPADLSPATALKSILIVPAVVRGRIACALATVTFRVYHASPAPLVARFGIVGQILAGAVAGAPGAERPPAGRTPVMRSLDAVERDHLRAVLEHCGWKINGPGHAAEVLGLHPNTLRFRMKKLGVVRPKARASTP